MYDFILNLWLMYRISEAQIDTLVLRGRLTLEQGEEIKDTPR